MNKNPYQPTSETTHDARVPVLRYGVFSIAALILALLVFLPAAFLLIQKWTAARTGVGIYDAEFNGQPISIDAVIAWSVSLSIPFWILGLISTYVSLRNWRRNRQSVYIAT